MSSKRFTDRQLEQLLEKRAARLARLVELGAPAPILRTEVGMVVSAARLLLGRKEIDEQIDDQQALSDALEAGLCGFCRLVPAIVDSPPACRACLEKSIQIAAGARDDILDS